MPNIEWMRSMAKWRNGFFLFINSYLKNEMKIVLERGSDRAIQKGYSNKQFLIFNQNIEKLFI